MIKIQWSQRFCFVTVPSLGVLNRPTSLSVICSTLKDDGRFRTPRDGMVTGWRRGGHGHGKKTLAPLLTLQKILAVPKRSFSKIPMIEMT